MNKIAVSCSPATCARYRRYTESPGVDAVLVCGFDFSSPRSIQKQLATTINGTSDVGTIKKGQLINVSYETLVCSMTDLVIGV